jgi:hypothetical protein
MTGDSLFLAGAAHLVADALLAIGLLKAYQWVRRQSPQVAAVMALGILARAAIGAALFWVSYLDLPFLRQLHSGDGFWQLAPDARTYYSAAALAYFEGFSALPSDVPSPIFIKMLTGWMHLVGVSPASGPFLNLTLYALLCVLVVRVCRPAESPHAQLACIASLVPFSIAPVLLVHGSQPLKDEVFVFLNAITCLSVLALLRAPIVTASRPGRLPFAPLALAGLGIAAYAMAGIRLYFVGLVLAALSIAAAVHAIRACRDCRPRALAAGLAGILIASAGPLWMSGVLAGSSEADLRPTAVAVTPSPPSTRSGGPWSVAVAQWERVLAQIRESRTNFQLTGGASNLATGQEQGWAEPLLVGAAAIFVPISVVKALGWADFDGGRGLLVVTDIDTVLLDLSILAAIGLVVVRRRWAVPNAPYVWYVLSLALVTTVLLAFVVTNFGTLFRLRLLMAVPLWMLPLAACRPPQEAETVERTPRAVQVEETRSWHAAFGSFDDERLTSARRSKVR